MPLPRSAIFDTHCHLGFGEAAPAAVHSRALEAGVERMLDVGIDLVSSTAACERAAALRGVGWTAGLHPNHAGRLEVEWAGLEALGRRPDCCAVGETGLDFHWNRATAVEQVAAFERHLAFALDLGKPVVVHSRAAFPRTHEVLEAFPGVRGVFHCFSGGVDEARRALDLGFYLSFAGPLTYPKADDLRAAARFAPADRVLVETDAPFLPPQGRRGEPNEPAWVRATLERLAAECGLSFEAAAARTTANGERLFGPAPPR